MTHATDSDQISSLDECLQLPTCGNSSLHECGRVGSLQPVSSQMQPLDLQDHAVHDEQIHGSLESSFLRLDRPEKT